MFSQPYSQYSRLYLVLKYIAVNCSEIVVRTVEVLPKNHHFLTTFEKSGLANQVWSQRFLQSSLKSDKAVKIAVLEKPSHMSRSRLDTATPLQQLLGGRGGLITGPGECHNSATSGLVLDLLIYRIKYAWRESSFYFQL